MGNESVVEDLKKLQKKLTDTIYRLENNDDDGDGIIDKGHITPDEQKQIDAIVKEIDDFKTANKSWLRDVEVKFEPNDETTHRHTQDEDTRKQKDEDKRRSEKEGERYSNTSASVKSKTSAGVAVTWDNISTSLTQSITASFSAEVHIPIIPGIDFTAGFGLSASAKVEAGSKIDWSNGLSSEVKFGVGAELKGEVSFGLLLAKVVQAKASPYVRMFADLEAKVSANNKGPKVEIGNLVGGINTGIEFSLGPAGYIADALDAVYDGLSGHLSISYKIPEGEFLVMKSKMNEFKTNMFTPKEVEFSKGKTLIMLEKKMKEYQTYIEDILKKAQEGLIEVGRLMVSAIESIGDVASAAVDYASEGLDIAGDAVKSQVYDLAVQSMTITTDDTDYDFGEEMDVTVNLKLKDDDWFDDTHEAEMWIELYYGEKRVAFKKTFFKITRQHYKTYSINIPKGLPDNWDPDNWGVCVWIGFNNNRYQENEWEYGKFSVYPLNWEDD